MKIIINDKNLGIDIMEIVDIPFQDAVKFECYKAKE